MWISEEESVSDKVIISFSARSNLSRLFSHSIADDSIASLHGIRFLSLLWVMLAHSCLISLHLADNQRFRERAEGHILYQILSSGGLSVDTFFFIRWGGRPPWIHVCNLGCLTHFLCSSGFLVSFLYFRSTKSPEESLFSGIRQGTSSFLKSAKHFASMTVYRLVRLSPSYMATIAVVTTSMRWLRANVVADLPFSDAENCPRFWWRNALYINTFFSNNERVSKQKQYPHRRPLKQWKN